MSNKNGFTLVGLLAVIGIVGILTLTVSSAVISILNNQKETLAKDTEKRLKDAAISYVQEKKIYLTKCPIGFNPENPTDANKSCYHTITVEELKQSGLFDDFKGYCQSNARIIIYKETNQNYTDLKAFAKEGICK